MRPENERAFRKAVGRPAKCGPEITRRVCKHLADGSYIETACAAAGIGKTTLHNWLKTAALHDAEGQEGTVYQEFRDAVEEAQAKAEQKDLRAISKAANKGNWNAAAWRLERRNPRRWAPTKRLPDDDEDSADSRGFILNYNLEGD